MKQTKKIETFEQLHANEMALVKGGTSSNKQADEQASEQTVIIYINGKPYRITAEGLQPL